MCIRAVPGRDNGPARAGLLIGTLPRHSARLLWVSLGRKNVYKQMTGETENLATNPEGECLSEMKRSRRTV